MLRAFPWILLVVVVLVAVWLRLARDDERPAGGAQQPSPHAIDQKG